MWANTAISRRHFLKIASSTPLATIGAPPALSLLATILSGQSRAAFAQELGIKPRTFINITASGGPARWMYNNFMDPYGVGGFTDPNPMIATEFKEVGGRYIGAHYVTHDVKGIKVPTFWTHRVPTPGGGYRPVADLLDNMLCIQGINTRNDGHNGSQLNAFLPDGAKQSAVSLSGDAANFPIAGIDLGSAQYVYKSIKSKSSVNVNARNGIAGVLSTFQPTGGARYLSDKAIFDSAMSSLLPELDIVARKGHRGAQVIIENRDSAIKLAQSNLTNLTAQWTALVSKYRDLVSRAIYDLNNPLKGINDLPIGDGSGAEAPFYELDFERPLPYSMMSDYRNVVGPESTVSDLAERFALTEYVILNKLTNSVSFDTDGVSRLYTPTGAPTAGVGSDSHTSGKYAHVLIVTLQHRAVATCILELITRLKAAEMFNDVVIREAGEFNRVPNRLQSGSDHGAGGQSQAFYSGAFSGPLIIGNLLKANREARQWGAGGKIPELGRQLYSTDMLITLAHLLGVPAPLTSGRTVATLSGSGLVSNIGTTTYV